jgi:gliding motility-associated lipoprotein GldD
MINRFFFIFLIISTQISCYENNLPKPKGFLNLEYPIPEYIEKSNSCGFTFEINKRALIENQSKECWNKIIYPDMKATIYLSYFKVKNNINSLLEDAYQMPMKHVNRAIEIPEKTYYDEKNKTFGSLFRVEGNAASQLQFFLTDSISNFLVGSLYFYSKPNYDSLMPAARYIENDMLHLMETLNWKK